MSVEHTPGLMSVEHSGVRTAHPVGPLEVISVELTPGLKARRHLDHSARIFLDHLYASLDVIQRKNQKSLIGHKKDPVVRTRRLQ